jgi:hypothetical protein
MVSIITISAIYRALYESPMQLPMPLLADQPLFLKLEIQPSAATTVIVGGSTVVSAIGDSTIGCKNWV